MVENINPRLVRGVWVAAQEGEAARNVARLEVGQRVRNDEPGRRGKRRKGAGLIGYAPPFSMIERHDRP